MAVDATYDTTNYRQQGGSVEVINGELRMGPQAQMTANGTQAGPTAALTSAAGTPGTGTVDVGAAFSQATLNNNFATLVSQVNAILTILKNLGMST